MFIGHYGIAFGAKAAAPSTSLGTLFVAAQFADLLWPVLLLTGIERIVIQPGATKVTPIDFVYYPFSHSLLSLVVMGMLAGCIYMLLTRYRRGAVVICLLVISHWLLDALVHRPDLPLSPDSERFVGLGLWSSPLGSLFVELLIFTTGVWFYLRSTVSKDTAGRWALWPLVSFLVIIYAASVFGPPPPDVATVAWAGQAQWLFILSAFWIDRHRRYLCCPSQPY